MNRKANFDIDIQVIMNCKAKFDIDIQDMAINVMN